MLSTTLQKAFLAALLLLLVTYHTTGLPTRRDLIEPDLGAHDCFEEKRGLIHLDLEAHNCEGREGRGYRGECCTY